MKSLVSVIVFAAAALFTGSWAQAADGTVTLSKLHLCCGKCVKGVEEAAGSVGGLKHAVNKNAGTVALTGSAAAIQKGIDAIAAAGYHGESDQPKIKMSDDSGAADAEVASLKLEGFHNCCGTCTTDATKAVTSVAGVASHTVAKGSDSFEVKGKFNARKLVEALNKAGYHVKVAR